jgi:hypothetical protein
MQPRTRLVRIGCAVMLALLAARAGRAAQEAPTLAPVDEAASRPDFFTFRARLVATIARHDAAALMAVVHRDIKWSFGGGEGKASFEEHWRPSARDSRLWETLATVLALGGSFQSPEVFMAPYTFSRWPGHFDSFEHVAVIGDRVRIRRAPDADAQVIGSSSFGILPLARPSADPGESWTAVRIGGETGFIASRLVRSPIDYRAAFTKQDGGWLMTLLVAGD